MLANPLIDRAARAGYAAARAALWTAADAVNRFRRGPKLYVVNLHRQVICCTMRDDDLSRMRRFFAVNGFIEVHQPRLADVLLLNTCAFDREREDTSVALIKEFVECRGELLVTGCIGKINEDRMRQDFSGTYLAPPDLESGLDRFLEAHGTLATAFGAIDCHGRERRLYDGGSGWRRFTRPCPVPRSGAVKIVNGCPQRCAYCTHKMSIGFKPRSESYAKIEASIRRQVEAGAEVIQLLGDNLGPYGVDSGSSIPRLLDRLAEAFPDTLFALDQYHAAYFVRDFPRGLREHIAAGRIHELKMPIQSGCPRVLEAMNRRTNLEKLAEYIRESADLAPSMLFVTHIITGFPTETEAEFRESLDYVKAVFRHNALVYVFPCSVHPDTPAATLSPRVPYADALRRARLAEKELLAEGIDVCLDQLDELNARGTGP